MHAIGLSIKGKKRGMSQKEPNFRRKFVALILRRPRRRVLINQISLAQRNSRRPQGPRLRANRALAHLRHRRPDELSEFE